jgi:hypothetical protein
MRLQSFRASGLALVSGTPPGASGAMSLIGRFG